MIKNWELLRMDKNLFHIIFSILSYILHLFFTQFWYTKCMRGTIFRICRGRETVLSLYKLTDLWKVTCWNSQSRNVKSKNQSWRQKPQSCHFLHAFIIHCLPWCFVPIIFIFAVFNAMFWPLYFWSSGVCTSDSS